MTYCKDLEAAQGSGQQSTANEGRSGNTLEPSTDLRNDYVGSEKAAQIIGVRRTQAWRLAKGWWEDGERYREARQWGFPDVEPPAVPVVKMGTDTRPEYKFSLPDLIRYGQERRAKKARRRLKKAQKSLRALAALAASRGLTIPEVVDPMVSAQRRTSAVATASRNQRQTQQGTGTNLRSDA